LALPFSESGCQLSQKEDLQNECSTHRFTDIERIDGTFARSVNLANGKSAVIQKSKEFTLEPWRSEMEQFRGKNA
jgi:Protein of unknown function (DUF3363)